MFAWNPTIIGCKVYVRMEYNGFFWYDRDYSYIDDIWHNIIFTTV